MRFKEWCKKNSININAFCRDIGISRATATRLCRGKSVSIETAIKVLKKASPEVTLEDLAQS